jgi:hypothetical protein
MASHAGSSNERVIDGRVVGRLRRPMPKLTVSAIASATLPSVLVHLRPACGRATRG